MNNCATVRRISSENHDHITNLSSFNWPRDGEGVWRGGGGEGDHLATQSEKHLFQLISYTTV